MFKSIALAVVLASAPCAFAADSDELTPVVASGLNPVTQAFEGADGRQHLVYELVLTNANTTQATLQRIDVVDASSASKVLATYQGEQILKQLRATNSTPAQNATIELNGTRLFLVDITLEVGSVPPANLLHRIQILGGGTPAPVPQTPVQLTYSAAPIHIVTSIATLGPPLAGTGWVALNGCCDAASAHRASSQTVNGKICYGQRFAIDWMRLDASGQLVHGDPADVHSYPAYDADILAVAEGTVVQVLNDLTDQKPGSLPDPKTITLENVDGNHVVLDLGNGLYAFYAHMRKGSVTVAPGDHVKRGQVLGKLGNTGNTSAPHLHFHLMDGRSPLGSNGLPYLIDSFTLTGQVPAADFAKAQGVEGNWSHGIFPAPQSKKAEFPLDLDIIAFPTH